MGYNIFEQVKALGIEYDSHESDLYIPVTEQTQALMATYSHRKNVLTFTSKVDGKLWYDIPFAFAPWWEARRSKSLPVPPRPCTANDMTFDGSCLNCGGINHHAPQPKKP
jgi:hypothetical protein